MNINRDGFNGDLNVALDGLPEGITMLADTVPGSVSAVPMVFESRGRCAHRGPAAHTGRPTGGRGQGERRRQPFSPRVEWVRIQTTRCM